MTETVREVPIAGMKSLRVTGPENLGGTLTVTTRRVQSVRLEMVKILKAASESEAAAFERDVQIEVTPGSSELSLTVRTRRGVGWEGDDQSARVELGLTIPENWDLVFDGRFFELDLSGPFRQVDVRTEYGRVKLKGATQKSRITGSYTAVEMLNPKGEIVVQTSFADLVVRDAIPSAETPARLTNSFGAIVIEKFAGAIDAETENAPIFLTDAVLLGSGSSLRSANAMVKAEISEFGNAELDIRNVNGTVALRVPGKLSARINCSVGAGGSIQTGGITIQTHPDLLATGRLEGVCGDGRGVIDIEIDGPGHIGIQGE